MKLDRLLAFSTLLGISLVFFVPACGSSSDDDNSDDDDSGSSSTDCPGDFAGPEGPGCCESPDQTENGQPRASCVEGEWTCSEGEVCTCNGQVANYECVGSCEGSLSAPPGCVFGDHWECFEPTPVSSEDCD